MPILHHQLPLSTESHYEQRTPFKTGRRSTAEALHSDSPRKESTQLTVAEFGNDACYVVSDILHAQMPHNIRVMQSAYIAPLAFDRLLKFVRFLQWRIDQGEWWWMDKDEIRATETQASNRRFVWPRRSARCTGTRHRDKRDQ